MKYAKYYFHPIFYISKKKIEKVYIEKKKMSLHKDLNIFCNHRYVHPWEEMEALIQIWLKHNIKSKREITGEYFYLYHEWLSSFLDDDETKANSAIVKAILRRYDHEDARKKGAISTET